jgi:hypothetical protein
LEEAYTFFAVVSWVMGHAVITGRQGDGKESVGLFQHIPFTICMINLPTSLFLIQEAGNGLTGTESLHPENKNRI